MKIGLITNFVSRGLAKDAQIVKRAATEHEYNDIQFDKPNIERMDINIHLEVIGHKMLANAKKNILIPNLEFLNDEQLAIAESTCIDAIWCKTNSSYEFLHKLAAEKTVYLGFASIDLLLSSVHRYDRFLHIAGKSQHRNTQAILDAWKFHSLPHRLIVVSQYFREEIPNVTFLSDVNEDEMTILMNECKYHILPSEYEGWGHALHEAMLLGVQILTTDDAPMSDSGHFLVPSVATRNLGQAILHKVSADDVAALVDCMTKYTMPSLRPKALAENEAFKNRLKELL